MAEWKDGLLVDFVVFQRGHDLPKTEMTGVGYPVAGSNGIIGYHEKYTTKAPAITIGRSGNVGNPYIYYEPIWAHNTTLYVKEFKEAIPEYVYYFLKTMDLGSYAGGSAVPTLNRNHIHMLSIRVPDKDTQRKIAKVLKLLDDKIETNEKINRNLQEQLEALYNKKIKNCVLPSRVVTLDELCDIFTGRKNANQNDEDGKYMFFTCGENPLRINSYIYDGPAIIISGNGSYTGRTLFYNGKFDLYQRTYACTLKESIVPMYIFGLYAILKIELHKKISGGTHGSSIPYIVMNDLAKFEFEINDDVFMEFSKQSKSILDVIMHNNEENEHLAELRDSLLSKLISGELDVSDLDI